MALTPPTLTVPTSNNTVVDDIVITFTDPGDVWGGAITAVKIDSKTVAVAHYAVASGTLTFDADYRDFAEARDDYSLTIEATGYDDATATIEVVVAAWNLLNLYQVTPHDDLADYEAEMINQLDYDGDDYTTQHQLVKDEIEEALTNFFAYRQQTIRDSEDDQNFQILDYILNPNKLRRTACALALRNLFRPLIITEGDAWDALYKKYSNMYKRSIESQRQLLRFNTTVTEDYSQNYGLITFRR